MAYKQLVAPRTGTKDGIGWCLRFTQSVFGAPEWYPSAREAWDKQSGRHANVEPPLGIAVPIWFDHYGSYGTPPKWGNWGHVAIRLADGRVLTSPFRDSQTDAKGKGQAIYADIDAMRKAMPGGATYLGWSEWMHNVQTVEAVKSKPLTTPPKPATGQEEDEDMIFIRKDNQAKVYAWSPLRGTKRPIGTTEWNAIKRAYGAAGLKLPLINTSAAETKHFGI